MEPAPMTPRPPLDVFQRLQPAEQDLLLEFVLVSGSLKALANSYGVSYPTIRARLDRLIERVEALRGEGGEDLLANKLADLVEAREQAMKSSDTDIAEPLYAISEHSSDLSSLICDGEIARAGTDHCDAAVVLA